MPKPKAFRTDKLIMGKVPNRYNPALRALLARYNTMGFWGVVNKDPRLDYDQDFTLYKLFLHIGYPARCDESDFPNYPHILLPGHHFREMAHLKGVREVPWREIERWVRDREKFLTLDPTTSVYHPRPIPFQSV